MNYTKEKFVRFPDWKSEKSDEERSTKHGAHLGSFKTTINSATKMGGSSSLNTKNLLKLVVLFQYIPRILRVYPLYKEVTRTSGILTETAWAGAAFNLFLYMLASHILGAFWYLFSIERETTCWKKAFGNQAECFDHSVYCHHSDGYRDILNESCPIQTPNATLFDFGIFIDALQSGVVESTDFPQKFSYCFWWGLQNLSSLGQNLKTSTFVWEIGFAVFISISGLVLFSFVIGNMQTYLQSTIMRLEEMRVKQRDAEQWMSHRSLPENLRERIRRYDQYKWQETRGVDEDNLIRNLPKDLRRDIKRHLCLGLLMRVPMFEKMDEQLLDAICDSLKPALYTENSFVVREGDPVDEMLFIIRGKLLSFTTASSSAILSGFTRSSGGLGRHVLYKRRVGGIGGRRWRRRFGRRRVDCETQWRRWWEVAAEFRGHHLCVAVCSKCAAWFAAEWKSERREGGGESAAVGASETGGD